MEYIIVGVDPGTTTGIAILDLNGRLLGLHSSKDMGVSETIDYIIQFGRASLIASDVNPLPHFVEKVSSKLGCQVYRPEHPLTVSEKLELTRAYQVENSHQRDALAASISAYNNYQNKFRKIESLDLGQDVKHNVIAGLAIKYKRGQPEKNTKPKKKRNHSAQVSVDGILRLKSQLEELQNEAREKDKRIENLSESLKLERSKYRREMLKESEIGRLNDIASTLRMKLREREADLRLMQQFRSIWHDLTGKKIKPVGLYPAHFEGMTYAKGMAKLDDPLPEGITLVFTDNINLAKKLNTKGIATLPPSILKEFQNCYYVNLNELHASERQKRVSLGQIVRNYRDERPLR